MQPLWAFVNQQEEYQTDFFYLCEDEVREAELGLETQARPEEVYNDEAEE